LIKVWQWKISVPHTVDCFATDKNGLLYFGTDSGFSGLGKCLPVENSQCFLYFLVKYIHSSARIQ